MRFTWFNSILLCGAICSLAACSSMPVSFTPSLQGKWNELELAGKSFNEAWETTKSLLQRNLNYQLEQIDRDDGVIRTHWSYTTTGEQRDDYRVRLTINFQGPHLDEKIAIKVEAQYGKRNNWTMGYDDEYLLKVTSELRSSLNL